LANGKRRRTRAVLKIAPSSEEVCPVRRTLTILVLTAAAVLAAGCASEDGDEAPAGAGPAASATSAAAGGAGEGAGGGRGDYGGPYGGGAEPTTRGNASGDAAGGVRIEGFAFAPATVDAKVGQQVTWEHRDAGATHTVTAVDGAFDSGRLAEGEEFSHRFRSAGSFAYRCAIHPDMRGTVQVGG
jgi:plastocyanin